MLRVEDHDSLINLDATIYTCELAYFTQANIISCTLPCAEVPWVNLGVRSVICS